MSTAALPNPQQAGALGNMQLDWEHREFIQNVQYNMIKVASFLNQFDVATRTRLALLNEKLTQLERQVQFIEGSVKHITQQQ